MSELSAMEIARRLVAVELLKVRVGEVGDGLRGQLGALEGGSKLTVTLPDPERPDKPIKCGQVSKAADTVTAVIGDRPAWEAWVRENYPHNVLTRPGRTNKRGLVAESFNAMEEGLRAAIDENQALSREDPWSPPRRGATLIMEALWAAGFTVVPIEAEDPKEEISGPWEVAVLECSREHGSPVAPDGAIPDGVRMGSNPGTLSVSKSILVNNPELAKRFMGTFDLAVLAGSARTEIESNVGS